MLTVNSGNPGRLVGVTDSATLLLQAVACAPGSRACVAVGTSYAAPAHSVFLSVSGGVPGSLQSVAAPVALDGIACPTASTCEAVGNGGTNGAAVVVTLSTS